jgi:hypothetical protein
MNKRINTMKIPHIHADVIKAWADGAEIEVRYNTNTNSNGWLPADAPNWSLSCSYRVKPEPKQNTRYHLSVTCKDGRDIFFGGATSSEHQCDNLRLTFDGDTNKLIKAEVLK